jgi:hypothetical protein
MATNRWLGVCAIAALAVCASEAFAQDDDDDDDDGPRRDVTCVAELGAITIRGNLQIPGRCTLTGTDVEGNVTLLEGGSLTARATRIGGNVEGNRADFVDVDGSRIEGRVRLEGLVGDESSIALTEIDGNVTVMENRSRFEILNNEFGRNLTVWGNSGGLVISGNSVDDDLSCFFNEPAPTGLGNSADETEGQCESLRPEPAPPAPPEPPPSPPPPAPAPPPPPAPAPAPAPAPPPPAPPPDAAAPPPAPELAPDEGGAGATGWPLALMMLPLLAWRRRRARAAA